MNFTTKTSTDKLTNSKDVKKFHSTKIFKEMDEVIGLRDFVDLGDKGKTYCAVMESNSGYSIILKISTIDFAVLSEFDQRSFEDKLISFAYGLDFPVKLVRSNRKQDFSKYLTFLEEISKRNIKNKLLLEYKEELVHEFELMEKTNRSNIKSNYIVVYSNNPNKMLAFNEVKSRANYILRTLQNKDFRTSIVSNLELYDYLYFNFHRNIDVNLEKFFERDVFRIVSDRLNGSFHPIYKKDSVIELEVNKELEKKAEEEEELKKKLKPNEYKKHLKKMKAIQDKQDKQDKDDLLKYKLFNTAFTDILKPDVFETQKDYIQLGPESYVRMLAVTTPPQAMNILTLNGLNKLDDVEMHIHLEQKNGPKAVKLLRRELSKIYANIIMNEKKRDTPEHGKRKLAANMEGLVEALETNEDKLFHAQILLKIYASNLKELEEKTKRLQEIYVNEAIDVKVLFYDQKPAFINTLPSADFSYKEHLFNVLTGGAITLIPTGNSHLRHDEGIYIGNNVINNAPIIIDKFLYKKSQYRDYTMYSNPNIYVAGIPGSGKSTFIKLSIARSMMLGDLNIGIDPHGEYAEICKELNGKYIPLQSGVKSGINPLDMRVILGDDGKRYVPVSIKINEVTSMISNFVAINRQNVGLVGTEIATVSKAIANLYEKFGITKDENSIYEFYEDENGELQKRRKDFPTLSDLKQEIININNKIKEDSTNGRNLDEVIELMNMITGDGTMNIFDCKTDERIVSLLENRLVIFGLKELDPVSQTYAMTTMLNWLWSVFSDYTLKDIQKNILVDEGWKLAGQEESLEMLDNAARSGRKFRIALMIATQSIKEFQQSPKGESILNFCSYKFIFKQDAKLASEIGEYFGLSDSVVTAMPNFERGQCAIISEVTNAICQVRLFKFEEKFATT